jgi:hypothetical protein
METITDSRVLGQEHSMNQKFTLPQEACKIHKATVAGSHSRYAVDHVQFDSPAGGKIRASATDHSFLITAEWYTEEDSLREKNLLVPAALLKRIPAPTSSSLETTIEASGEGVTVSAKTDKYTTVAATGAIGTGKFAPIDNVIPDYSKRPDAPEGTVFRVTLSRGLLLKMLECFPETRAAEDGIHFVFPASPECPVTAEQNINSVRILGVLAQMAEE